MLRRYIKTSVILFFLSVSFVFAQQVKNIKPQVKKNQLTRILFIFDASYSMNGMWQSDTKIAIAKKLLGELLDSLKQIENYENIEVALRVYGHQKPVPPQDCDDTRLEISFSKKNYDRIKNKLQTIIPKGTTPIAQTLQAAAGDFTPCQECRNVIILITDGLEECKGDPCAVSKELQKKGIFLKPFIVGIGLKDKSSLECAGNYFDAENEETFKNILNVIITQVLNSTTAQVNLLDINGKPTETDVNMTFYDINTGNIKYNFIHTINDRGNPDTLRIDHLPTYKIFVHTIPPVSKDSVKLIQGKHNIVGIDAPQGYLTLKVQGLNDYKKTLQCIVRKAGEMATLNVQEFNQTVKYIVGKYDLEVLCLPRLIIKDVKISQSTTTTVEIPQPGIATVIMRTPGIASIFLIDKKELKFVCNINPNATQESFLLEPGNYKLVYRARNSKEVINTIEKTFKVEAGASINISIF